MKTLTLDLGTDTGWALMDGPEIVKSGTLHLASDAELEIQRREGKDRTLDVRFVRFYRFVGEHALGGVHRIVFEDVGFASTRMQTQLWASLRCAIWMVALMHPELAIYAVPVGTLKQFGAGNVRAKKADMAKALANHSSRLYVSDGNGTIIKPNGNVADDDEVDALWLVLYTRAVDDGQAAFLTAFQRKQLKKLEQQKKRAERKQRVKAKKAAAKALKLLKKISAKH
jgi:hypothetical protein